MADQVKTMTGREAFTLVSDILAIKPEIEGLENVPTSGAAIIIANHPTGLADGAFVFDALNGHRPHHIFLANADALRVIPNAEDIIIPVEWVVEKRTQAKTRNTLMSLKSALKDGKAVVIFPAGVLAKLSWRGLIDKEWNPTAISMAKKHKVPIVPLRIEARNSPLYYFFAAVNKELRDITLFHELLNKHQSRPKLTFGSVIDPASLPRGTDDATKFVRNIVERL
ncbi:MAG: acyltransferase [Hyphomonadaceae bacterium]|nr:acyltransferase [Hyphomonadaceae bacterium]